MARLPRNPSDAVSELGLKTEASVLAVAPDHGFVEALAEGRERLVVVDPPPDLEAVPDGVEIVEQAPEAGADVVLAWIGVVGVRGLRELAAHVADDGELWAVLRRPERDRQAAVTEGEVRKALLPLGWREDRNVTISTDSFAVRFRKRR